MQVFIFARTSLNSFYCRQATAPDTGVLFLPFFPYREFTCTVTGCRQLYTTLMCSLGGYGYILYTNTMFLGELAYLSDIKEIDNT